MAISQAEIRLISRAFRDARQQARPMLTFPGLVPETLDEAYQVQDFSISQWDDRVAGWKIGGIPRQLRAFYGGIDRLVGPVFARSIAYAQPESVVSYPVFEGGFAAVEAELVLRIGRDCAPGEYSPEQAAGLVDALFLGVETAGSPLATINELGPCVIISDFGNNHGLIVGPEITNWREPGFGRTLLRTTIDGEVMGEGIPDDLIEGPLGSLSFLLEVLGRRGLSLTRGDLVTTGALTGVHSVSPGSRSLVEIPGLATVEVLAVAGGGNLRTAGSYSS